MDSTKNAKPRRRKVTRYVMGLLFRDDALVNAIVEDRLDDGARQGG